MSMSMNLAILNMGKETQDISFSLQYHTLYQAFWEKYKIYVIHL